MTKRPVAIITGATGGIGRAVVRRFAMRGYDLALLDTCEVALSDLVREIEPHGCQLLPLPGDLADTSYAEQAVANTIDQFKRVDVLVNNAAWRELATMREISLESWERTLRVCLTAPAFLARWCADDMEKRGRGAIVNVTSIMAQQAGGFSPAYVACKGALESLTYELAALYGPRGIRVVAVAPGAIDTPMNVDIAQQSSSEHSSMREFVETMVPLGRWGTADEIAHAIAWLASDDAAYVTGTTLVIDGGWLRHHLPTSLAAKLNPGQF